jgi:hypothetical protein
MRWTRSRQQTADAGADGQAVWSWRSEAGAKFLRSKLPRDDGGNQAMVTGESAEYAVKPLRREGRVVWLNLWFCRVLFVARGPWVPAGARSSLRPLLSWRGRPPQNSGAIRAARARGFAIKLFDM